MSQTLNNKVITFNIENVCISMEEKDKIPYFHIYLNGDRVMSWMRPQGKK